MPPVWDQVVETKFNALIQRIPIFLRPIAEEKITKKAIGLAQAENRSIMTEKDMVDAFFAETPFGFHGPMKSDMDLEGIDYKQYGHQ